MDTKWEGVIFTPENEPYLGMELLHAFDELIVACLEANSKIAPYTTQIPLRTDIQDAACLLIPQGINLSLAIREMVRQGYLFAAKVLIRPLVERSVTIVYLCNNPEGIAVWNKGWNYKERPSLAKMIDAISTTRLREEFGSDIGRQMTAVLNSLTHGDPASGFWNLIVTADGQTGFGVSKNLKSPKLCDDVCAGTIPWLAVLLGMMHRIFPGAQPSDHISVN